MIKEENIKKNYEMALEFNPESLIKVEMLYIPLRINNVFVIDQN